MITTLTKSQTKMIDTVQQEWLDMMFSCKLRTNRKEATKYINWLYKFCGYTKPIIIFLSSPLATQIGANALVNVLSKYDWSKVKKEQIRSQIGSQIGSQIRSQIYSQIRSQIDSQIYSQIRSQIRSQIDSQIDSQIYSQIRSQIRSQIDSQIRSQIGSQIGSQIRSQIYSQIDSQIRSQIGSQIDSQIDSQIYSQIDSQIGSQIRSQIRSQIDSQIYSQIYSQIRSQIDSQIRSQIGSQIDSQIRSQIGSQIGSQIRSQKLKYYNWSWEGSIYYWNYYSYLQYYQKAKLLPKELFKNFNNLVTLCKSGVYDMIQLDGLCVVSDMPTFISRDERHRLHNTKGPAIKFADGYELNFIQGGAFNDKKLFKGIVKGTLSAEYILTKIENTEQRRIAWELMDKAKIKKLKNLKVLDEQVDGKGKKMKIFTFTVKGFNIPFYIYEGIDASTNRYYHLETDKKDCWSAKAGFVGLKADEVIYIEEY